MTLLAGVFLASILGSIHCAAMCGAFVCAYAAPNGGAGVGARAHAAYHVGRLMSYAVLGAVAGAIGSGVNRAGALAGVGRGAAITAGILMIVWAGAAIAAAAGVRVPSAAPAWATRSLGSLLLRVRDATPPARALAIGLLTTLLPCGWLYAFVATAGGTGSAVTGAAVMGVFWVGTVPALLTIGAGVRRASGPLARRLPLAAAALVLLLGVLAVAGRLSPPAFVAHSATQPVMHHAR